MAWIGPVVAAGASLIGDSMAQSGQSAANAMNMAEIKQEEGWMTTMSDTAMVRRVEDLKNAGLNPLLAVGQQGASVPGIGQIAAQNPNAAFANMGSQVGNALQLATQDAQVQQMKAQADKTRADTATVYAQLPYTGATAQASMENLQKQTRVIVDQANTLEQAYDLKSAPVSTLAKDPRFANQLQDLQLQAQQLDVQRARLGMPRLEDDASWQRAHPELSGWLQSGAAPAAQSAASVVSKFVP